MNKAKPPVAPLTPCEIAALRRMLGGSRCPVIREAVEREMLEAAWCQNWLGNGPTIRLVRRLKRTGVLVPVSARKRKRGDAK
ncbi:hypothetical protein IMZ48_25580 [Candidatus Bathyarchaeota archaeon]|nr:hypothetical protein [Candidatus Bathyarchaeota archaeon]MBE3117515.1 hypothetical protein [Candidatus Atribacteria bacterium]